MIKQKQPTLSTTPAAMGKLSCWPPGICPFHIDTIAKDSQKSQTVRITLPATTGLQEDSGPAFGMFQVQEAILTTDQMPLL
jgi:hypothetical protein